MPFNWSVEVLARLTQIMVGAGESCHYLLLSIKSLQIYPPGWSDPPGHYRPPADSQWPVLSPT